jgi:putative two-component system response regulator
VVKRVKETGEPWQTLDAFQDANVSMTASLFLSGARSVMCVPLRGVGQLYADNRLGPNKFEEPELALLTILADMLAGALARARTTERLAAANEELRASREETITRLAVAADWRDTETATHIERVGQYAASLAQWAGCPADYVEQIRLASKMHDVGKLGVPDAILRKPGKFTPEEFEQMKQHTQMGGRILEGSSSPLIQMAHRIALFHHERWDGRGYPHGVGGEEIPLEGRITAICDAFDAMCSRRVYKEAYPLDMAFGVIESELGKHFDPNLGRLFIDHRHEVIEIKMTMQG